MLAEKLLTLGNFAIISLIFGQFLSATPLNPWAVITGLIVFIVGYTLSYSDEGGNLNGHCVAHARCGRIPACVCWNPSLPRSQEAPESLSAAGAGYDMALCHRLGARGTGPADRAVRETLRTQPPEISNGK